jgi:RNA polymerase sigma-70 factor (ECF subfamily)
VTITSRPTADLPAADLLAAARSDAHAFERLVAPHRRELSVHCYRMLGSLDDADDAMQETLLKAWRHLAGFERRSSLRAWLYRIATNTCLDALDHRARRVLPVAIAAPADPATPPAPDDHEVPWLQPYPDTLLDTPDPDADPAAVLARREHIELAFVAAVQYLPARQRAALLLREVIGFTAAETATLLDTSPAAVNSALQRAKAALETGLPAHALHRPTGDAAELVGRYLRAWDAADVPALVALLRADAHMAMPPTPSWYQGREAIAVYLRHLFASPWGRDLRLVPTAANRQPALAVYAPTGGPAGPGGPTRPAGPARPGGPARHEPLAVKVFTVEGGLISAVTGFVAPGLFPAFGLPDTLR